MENLKEKIITVLSDLSKKSIILLNKIPTPVHQGASVRFSAPKDQSDHFIKKDEPCLGLGTTLVAVAKGQVGLIRDDLKVYVHEDDVKAISKDYVK